MIPEEAIESIRRLGYTPEEARFLYLAAIHSGYFLRRQYNNSACVARGGQAAQFIEKVRTKGHAHVVPGRSNPILYHIQAKNIYNRADQMDQTDNRNRREKAPVTIKRKLMCLDFVLDHREHHFLTSEAQKVAYFTSTRHIPREKLPVRCYKSRRSEAASTLRYFVDKMPIYVTGDSPAADASHSFSSAVVHFAYVDEGAETIQGFETFLRQYHGLFMGLRTFEVIHVAADSALSESAGRLFRRFYPEDGSTALGGPDPEQVRLLQYFQMRRKRELNDNKGLTAQALIHHREEKDRFSAPEFDALYSVWVFGGERALRAKLMGDKRLTSSFRTYTLPHNYEVFGRLLHAS